MDDHEMSDEDLRAAAELFQMVRTFGDRVFFDTGAESGIPISIHRLAAPDDIVPMGE